MSFFSDERRDSGHDVGSRLTALRTRAADWVRERRADYDFRQRTLPEATPAGDAPRHVVCVVVDSLRADAVNPTLTPFLDSVSPLDAVSPSTWTFPAVSSLLTGEYPHEHGATRQTDDYENSVADVTPLPPQMPHSTDTLPELLAGAGYDTFGEFSMIVPFLALSGRFETHRLRESADAAQVLADHESWVSDRRGERTFSYLHLDDLHEPVSPPSDYTAAHDVDESIPGIRRWRYEDVVHRSPTVDRYRTHRKRLYRAAVEYVDNELAASHARLTDLLDDVLFVVVGDHGEGFWEQATAAVANFADPRPAYCVGHGGAPYEAVTRVPLAVTRSGPASTAEEIDPDGRASLVDVTPTVLDAVGLDTAVSGVATRSEPPAGGVSLLDSVPERRLLVESVRYGFEKKAVYDGNRKLLVSNGDDIEVCLSLPDETVTRPPDSDLAAMRNALPPWPEGDGQPRASPQVQRRLETLGYT